MKLINPNLKLPTLISFILILPFVILELVNRRNFQEGFPIMLFGLLWILPILFIVTLMPLVRNIRAGNNLMAHPLTLFIRVVFLIFLALMWVSILVDQMPCFMGVLNCD
jgi:hypothetical protein